METPNETRNIHDALRTLLKETDNLLAEANKNAKNINIPLEAQKSKRYDTIARFGATLIEYRKQTGSKDPIWFFKEE